MPRAAADRRPISHVVIGPKNPAPPAIVYAILGKYGHFECEVIESAATYR